jgi:hypothetical protein
MNSKLHDSRSAETLDPDGTVNPPEAHAGHGTSPLYARDCGQALQLCNDAQEGSLRPVGSQQLLLCGNSLLLQLGCDSNRTAGSAAAAVEVSKNTGQQPLHPKLLLNPHLNNL